MRHDDDEVGELHRLVLVVGDEDGGEAGLVVDFAQAAAELLADAGVERAEGLVEEEHARLDGERAGEGDALALAAGELGRVAAGRCRGGWMRSRRRVTRRRISAAGGRLAARAGAQAVGDVLEDRHVAEEGVVLEDEAGAALLHA